MQPDTREIDADALPLILLPGTLCDERLFAPLRARLATWSMPERPIIVGDMQGLRSAAALADRLLADAPPRFALLGFSLGALVALEIAAHAPGRVAGLALVGGNGHALTHDDRARRSAAAAAVTCVGTHVGETLWYASVADPQDHALRELIVEMALACPVNTLPAQVEVAVSRADSLPRLSALIMPTLVLAGAQDAINPPALQHRLAAGLPDARLVLVPQAGHFVLLERPDACAAAVRGWLADIDNATTAAKPGLKEFV